MKNRINISEPVFSSEEIVNLKKVLKSGWLTQGKYVQKFENQFSKFHGFKHSLATTSCTTALHLILSALDIKNGDGYCTILYLGKYNKFNNLLWCKTNPS